MSHINYILTLLYKTFYSFLINEMWFFIVGKNANNDHINRLVSKNSIENDIK